MRPRLDSGPFTSVPKLDAQSGVCTISLSERTDLIIFCRVRSLRFSALLAAAVNVPSMDR